MKQPQPRQIEQGRISGKNELEKASYGLDHFTIDAFSLSVPILEKIMNFPINNSTMSYDVKFTLNHRNVTGNRTGLKL